MKIKIEMSQIKTFNIDNINENFFKELLKNTLKKIILDMITIYDEDNKNLNLKSQLIEENIINILIKYYQLKQSDQQIINSLLNFKKHKQNERKKHIDIIEKKICNNNYVDYKIY